MAKVRYTVRGEFPGMLQNNPAKMIRPDDKGQKKQIPTPEKEAESGVYRNGDGNIVFTLSCVVPSMITAAKGHKIGRLGVFNFIQGGIINVTGTNGDYQWMDLTDYNGVPLTGYEIDTRRAVIIRAAVMRSRPLLPEWQTKVTIEYLPEEIALETITQYLSRAGIVAGWGDYGPRNGGPFGRFKVIKEEPIP